MNGYKIMQFEFNSHEVILLLHNGILLMQSDFVLTLVEFTFIQGIYRFKMGYFEINKHFLFLYKGILPI